MVCHGHRITFLYILFYISCGSAPNETPLKSQNLLLSTLYYARLFDLDTMLEYNDAKVHITMHCKVEMDNFVCLNLSLSTTAWKCHCPQVMLVQLEYLWKQVCKSQGTRWQRWQQGKEGEMNRWASAWWRELCFSMLKSMNPFNVRLLLPAWRRRVQNWH